ncbi:hypothetical protein D9M69_642960 [compost metagenome]
MKEKPLFPLAMENVRFDEYGQYEVFDVLSDEELELVGGGRLINVNVCPNDVFCPRNDGCNPPPPTPPRNPRCGEDGDDEQEYY